MDIYGDFVVIHDDKSYGKNGEIRGINKSFNGDVMMMLWLFIEIHAES